MEDKPQRCVAQLSGTPGFTLRTVIRLLAAEWGVEAERIEEALWRDFEAGVFDPTDEALANCNVATFQPSADFACCWETVTEYTDLSDKKHTNANIVTSRSQLGSFRKNIHFFYGWDADTVYDRTVIPEGAIFLFCERWKRPEPAFLKDGDFATYPAEQDRYTPVNATGSSTKHNFGLFSFGATSHNRRQRKTLTASLHKRILQDLLAREPRSMDRRQTVEHIQDTYDLNRADARRIVTEMPEKYKFGRGERRSLLAKRRAQSANDILGNSHAGSSAIG